MKTFLPIQCFTLIFAMMMLCGVSKAKSEVPDHKLSEWEFGDVLFGERFSKNDLRGKVVLIENWGVRCPPCIAAMPHLADLDKKYRAEGLLIIGAECQGSSKEAIEPIIEKAKVNFTITERANGPIEFRGIPHCHLFDREGKLIYNGYPDVDKLKSAIRKALKESGGEEPETVVYASKPLIASRNWTNAEGKSITAAVKSVDSSNVVFIMSGGKEVTYPLEKLSEASQKDLREAAKPVDEEDEEDYV